MFLYTFILYQVKTGYEMQYIFKTFLVPVEVTKSIPVYLLREKTEPSLWYKYPKYNRLLFLKFPILHFQKLSGLSLIFQEPT